MAATHARRGFLAAFVGALAAPAIAVAAAKPARPRLSPRQTRILAMIDAADPEEPGCYVGVLRELTALWADTPVEDIRAAVEALS